MISLLNAAGAIAVFAAIQALWLGNLSKNVHIFRSYAFVSVFIACFLFATSAWYSAKTLEQAALAARWQTFSGLSHVVAFTWLLGHMSLLLKKRSIQYAYAVYTLGMIALTAAALLAPPHYFTSNVTITGTTTIFFQDVTAYQALGEHSSRLFNGAVLLSYAFCFYCTFLIYRNGQRLNAMWLASYLAIQAIYLLNRILSLELSTNSLPAGLPLIWLLIVISICFGREHHNAMRLLRKQEEELKTRAYYDSITGLPNELWLREQLSSILTTRQEARVLIMLHVNEFHAIRRTFGNANADDLIRQLADRIRNTLQPTDTLARLQDSTFCVIRHRLEEKHLKSKQQNINEELTRAYFVGSQPVNLTFQLGIIDVSLPDSAENALYRGYLAMQEAIRKGSNQAVFFDDLLEEQIQRDRDLEDALPSALENNEFSLHYQPKVDANGQCCGAEALLRWHHGNQGLISPAIFIPLAERSGFMPKLGAWVINEACAFLGRLREQNTHLPGRLSVNVSPWQLREETLPSTLQSALQATAIPAPQIEIELTESALVDSLVTARKQLQAIRELGVSIAVDDFGTGYSSLAYLQDLPLDVLKIDKQFVDNLNSTRGQQLVEGIINIGTVLDMTVVAEGIEDRTQLSALCALGCQYFQGYLFSKPLPEEAFGKWLRKNLQTPLTTS